MATTLSPPISLRIIKLFNHPPVWQPGAQFDLTSGTPKRWPIAPLVSDPDGDPLTMGIHIIPGELASHGVSFDSTTNELVYDGTPFDDVVTPDGPPKVYEFLLWASDGRND